MKFYSYLAALFAILIWGITFANTRSLLGDFSALEILGVRFALAWGALWGVDGERQRLRWTQARVRMRKAAK